MRQLVKEACSAAAAVAAEAKSAKAAKKAPPHQPAEPTGAHAVECGGMRADDVESRRTCARSRRRCQDAVSTSLSAATLQRGSAATAPHLNAVLVVLLAGKSADFCGFVVALVLLRRNALRQSRAVTACVLLPQT